MGKPTVEQSDSDQDSSLSSHFSHPHPLQLLNIQLSASFTACSACKLDSSGDVYCCTTCDFVIHKKCHSLPKRIKHEFDQAHVLSLQPKPVYPEGLFKCDACGKEGDGFSYHCSPCGTDLHSICASLPMLLAHPCHQHQLSLTFSSPYLGDAFSCDICKRVGTKIWLYRCDSCEFDVHLSCVATIPSAAGRPPQIPPQVPPLIASRSLPEAANVMYRPNAGVYAAPIARPPALATPYPAAMAPVNSMPVRPYNPPPGNYGPFRPANGPMGNQILPQVAGGIANGVASGVAQALVQGLIGGGGANDNAAVPVAGGSDVNQVDPMGGVSYLTADGGRFYDGNYGGTDAGYGGADGLYN